MLPLWTGEVVGTMHIHGITYSELAGKMGVTRSYLSRLINGKVYTRNAEQNVKKALKSLVMESHFADEKYY